ncbi:MAG: TIGR02597 family protein [Chthoniobacterales bacterium]
MHRLFFSSLAFTGLMFVTAASAAESSVTDPVGFTATTVAANTTKALSLPLDNLPDFRGQVSSRTATKINTNNANFNVSYGPFGTNPHNVRMLSGASQGRQFRIASNDSDTLTLQMGTLDLRTLIANGDRYEILTVETLGSLFGVANPDGLNTGNSAAAADNVILTEGTAQNTYFNNGSKWLKAGGGTTPQNNRAILPEQGFLFVRRGGNLPFVLTGAVPITKLRTDLPANRTTLFANRFPVDYKLTPDGNFPGINFQNAPNWNSAAQFANADFVQIRNGNVWDTYYHNGSVWLKKGAENLGARNPIIKLGTSVSVTRRQGNGKPAILVQTLPYNLASN